MALETLFHQLIVYLNYLAIRLLHVILLVHCLDFHQLCVLKGFFKIHLCENAYYDGWIDRHGFSLVCVFKWFVIFHLRESLVTMAALIWLFLSMCSQILIKICFLRESFIPMGTLIRSLPHVRSYMVCRKHILREHLFTIAVP